MPTTRDYYEILSVEKTADGEEIKRAYRRLAMKYHPDRNPGDKEAETKFKECAEAYEALGDPERRKVYDQFGHEGLRGRGGPAAHDFSRMNAEDIFSMFNDIFGGGMGARATGRGPRGVPRGFDLETEVVLDLEDVLKGAERDVEFTRMDVCDTCGGSGAKPGSKPVTCETCAGRGQVIQTGLGGMFRMQTTCPACRGRGSVVKDPCEPCKGRGRTGARRKLKVKIPAGIHDQQAVRIPGEGEPPPAEISPDGSGMRGDLHVVARIRQHEDFQRDGDNLVAELPISFTQAALGAHLEVPSIDGPASLEIPHGTQHGSVFKVHGAGLPNLRSGRRGDLVVVVDVRIPKKLTERQEELMREFAATEEAAVSDRSAQGAGGKVWKKIRDAIGGS